MMKISLRLTSKENVIDILLSEDQSKVFGRSSSADVKLDDTKVSGKHCQIVLNKEKLEITDLDSKNGTYLNGIQIEQAQIFLGDEIKIGDSIITVIENKADKEASKILAFAGEENNQELNELRLDFTGARIKNQRATRDDDPVLSINYHAREVELRKKAKSKIKLSKKEIRLKNKSVSAVATLADAGIMFLIFIIPLFIVSYTVPMEMKKSYRLLVFLVIETMAIPTFILKNFKTAKFTFGERLSGIQKLYEKQ